MKRLKEFELWFKKKEAGYSHAAYYTDKYEEGWEAALEWALTQQSEYEGLSPDEDFDYIDVYEIRRELNGEA